ncbi:MAG: peptidoglycan DD-metalloendopeptidase family protein [Thiogranum sp.]|nr:peptidoglycan DD-metalloendopeptidase family protein [Thiogranum sp.]
MLGLLCLAMPGMGAEDAVEKARELASLRAKIESLQNQLDENRKKKTAAENRLVEVERRISEITRTLRTTERQLTTHREQLQQLHVEQQQNQQDLLRQRDGLAAEARSAYLMGRQQQVKLLLNQEQPSAVGRMMVYFDYLSRARLRQINAMGATQQRLDQLELSIEEKALALTALLERQERDAEELRDQKQRRGETVAQLSKDLASQGDQLKRLQSDARQLEELVRSLQTLLADIPPDSVREQPFRKLKGKLRWPASGDLAGRFGSVRGDNGMKWQGVLIAAPEGGPIRAVSQGRIAFSDWMRGFGLLLIIDHGDGFMSLYGHNQSLYKEVGEWVDSGEVVATLGASGGQGKAGLYFELRHQGRPINPVQWCAGKPVPASS